MSAGAEQPTVKELSEGDRVKVSYVEVDQDLVNGSMQFSDPQTLEMTVTERSETRLRGRNTEREYVVPAIPHKKTIRARDLESTGTFDIPLGHRREIELLPEGESE